MDPLSVFRTLWRRKWLALPVVLVTLAGCAYVLALGPRLYESSASYVMITPQVPSDAQLEKDPALAALNSDNPYLRSNDPSLVPQVIIARLSSEATAKTISDQGLDGEFTVEPASSLGSQIIKVTGSASTPDGSLAITGAVGELLVKELRTIQTVNGADDRYLLTAQLIEASPHAVERVSSRLRLLIVVAIAGLVVLFGVVSLGESLARSKRRPLGIESGVVFASLAPRQVDHNGSRTSHGRGSNEASGVSVDSSASDGLPPETRSASPKQLGARRASRKQKLG